MKLKAFASLALAVGFAATAGAQTPPPGTLSPQTAGPASPWQPSLPSSPSSWSVNTYLWDDGTSENALGWQGGATSFQYDMGWINGYDAVGGSDVISAVLTTFGSSLATGTILNGDPAHVAVWEDPNDDGSPNDAVLLTQATVAVANVYTNTFNSYAVTPVAVSGHFFVGAWMTCDTATNPPSGVGEYPAPMDNSSSAPLRSFFVGGNPINPNNLAGNPNPVTDLTTYFQATFMVRGEGGSSSTVYCTAKVNSLFCTPAISDSGVPSATAASGHIVTSVNNRNQKAGLLFYSNTGQNGIPFQGGTLCVKTPIRRTPASSSGGTPSPANDCTGVYSIDMNTFAQGGLGGSPDPFLKTQGTVVNCQWWGRDPGFPAPNNTSLSDGLQFTIGP